MNKERNLIANSLLLAVSLFVTVLFNAGCVTSQKVPNEEGCVRLSVGAACAYTIEGEERDLSEAEWLSEELGRISFTPESFTEFRRFIEKSCAMHKDCTYDKIKLLERLDYLSNRLGFTDE